MTMSEKREVVEGRLATITTGPLPASRKLYLKGSLFSSVRVPVREIAQTPTRGHGRAAPPVPNPPLCVYDPSGPYTDPDVAIDVRRGLAPVRAEWVADRKDSEQLEASSSLYGRARRADARLVGRAVPSGGKPRRAK